MKSSAIRNLDTFYTPILVIISQNSSHEDILLSRVVPTFFAMNQAIFNDAKIIKIATNESNISIEEVRKLIEQLSFGSLNGELQAVLLPNIDNASIPAQNALLKILEEPPPNIQFFLTARAAEAVLETIRSRSTVQYLVNDSNADDIDTENSSDASGVLEKITTNSIRENIELAETYQNKQEAINILTSILKNLHTKLETGTQSDTQTRADHAAYTQACKNVVTAIVSLQQNLNVKLVLTECFIQLQKLTL